MKFIEPSAEYWRQESGLEGVWNQIARATRVCYQSKPREGESSEDFVKRIILKPALIEGSLDDLENCKFDFDKMHGAMLEHGTVYLTINYNKYLTINYNNFIEEDDDADYDYNEVIEFYENNKYSKFIWDNGICYVTTNMRVVIENNRIKDLRAISENIEYHVKRYTFSVITDIGVTREFNRHRTFSVAEQSTRYCDLTKDKFGNCLSFPLPSWINKDLLKTSEIDNCLLSYISDYICYNTYKNINNFKMPTFVGTNNWSDIDFYIYANAVAQYCYQALRNRGWRPEQARQVLPLGLKTQAVYTAFSDDWEHFLRLRADNVSGRAHPNIQLVAKEIKEIGVKEGLWK